MRKRSHSSPDWPKPPICAHVFIHSGTPPTPHWVLLSRPSRLLQPQSQLILLSGHPETVLFLGRIHRIVAKRGGWLHLELGGCSLSVGEPMVASLYTWSGWVDTAAFDKALDSIASWRSWGFRCLSQSISHSITSELHSLQLHLEDHNPVSCQRGPSLSLDGEPFSELWEGMMHYREAAVIASERRGSI